MTTDDIKWQRVDEQRRAAKALLAPAKEAEGPISDTIVMVMEIVQETKAAVYVECEEALLDEMNKALAGDFNETTAEVFRRYSKEFEKLSRAFSFV